VGGPVELELAHKRPLLRRVSTRSTIALSLGICLIPVLVARGIGHGSHDMWLLLLVLALLFTPAVRHHCAK
jgi:uncharacterized membrane protein